MSYQYTPSQKAEKKIDKASVGLQISHMLFVVVSIFASTFLISYIVKVNADNPLSASIGTIAIYYISQFIVYGLTYFLLSFVVAKTNRVWIFRIGILLYGAFIVLVIFVGKELAKYIVLAGAIYGLSEGFFYSAYNVIKGEMVPRRQMSLYSTLCLIIERSIKVVFPVLMGFLIDNSTFGFVAFFVLGVVIIQFGITFLIKSQRPDNSSFNFFRYLKLLKSKNEDMVRIRKIYAIAGFYGFKTVFNTLFSIITIYTFKTNVKLGIFTAINAVISIIALLLFKRFTKEGKRGAIYIVLGFSITLSVLIYVLFMNTYTYFGYVVCASSALNIFANGYDIERNLVIKKTGHYSNIAEHNCLIELIMTVSRIVVYSIMLVLGLTLDLLGIKICFVLASCMMPLACIVLAKTEKVEANYSIENPLEAQTVIEAAPKDEEN